MFYNRTSQDDTLSSDRVTASLTFQLPYDETNHKLVLEIHHTDIGTIETHTISLPEMPQIGNLTGIQALFPKGDILLDFTLLPVDRSSTIPLEVDLVLPHAGKYEVVKWAEGIDVSEQQQVLVVQNVND